MLAAARSGDKDAVADAAKRLTRYNIKLAKQARAKAARLEDPVKRKELLAAVDELERLLPEQINAASGTFKFFLACLFSLMAFCSPALHAWLEQRWPTTLETRLRQTSCWQSQTWFWHRSRRSKLQLSRPPPLPPQPEGRRRSSLP
jgi:hypothetical protein